MPSVSEADDPVGFLSSLGLSHLSQKMKTMEHFIKSNDQ